MTTLSTNDAQSSKGYPTGFDAYKVWARLREIRKKMAWTQEQLGKAVGLSANEIEAIESGKDVPIWDKLLDFARIFVFTGQHNQKNPKHNEPVPFNAHEFGSILGTLRDQKEWSLEQLGKEVKLTAEVIQEFESGASSPTWKMLLDFAQSFATSRNIRFDNLRPEAPMPFDAKVFGDLISQLRTKKGWKQEELSDATNTTNANIQKFEAGELIPTWKNLREFARVFGLFPVMIFNDPKPNDSISIDGAAFGTLLRVLRKREKWTQAELGSKIGVSEHVIATYETRHSRPKWKTVHLLSQTFQLHLEFLLVGLPPVVKLPEQMNKPIVDESDLNGEAKRKLLTKLVLEADERKTLYVAAGDASFLYLWLVELYDELSETPQSKKPKIDRVCILHASDTVLMRETDEKNIEPELQERLRINIKSVRRLLTREEVAIETRVLKRYPLYHGFQYGDDLLFGAWSKTKGGKLQGRSRMKHVTRQSAPKAFENFESEFNDAVTVEPFPE